MTNFIMETRTYVYFFETFEEEMSKFQSYLDMDDVLYTSKTIQEWLLENNEYKNDAPSILISIRTQSIVPESWFSSNHFKGIISRSTGNDHLKKIKKETQLELGFLPHYCSSAVAEHATMLWMSLLKKLPQQREQWKTFNRNNITCSEFGKNKSMLVVGVGNIGYKVANIAKALNIRVFGLDIVKKHNDIDYIHDLQNTIEDIDIIVCCMNLTSKNHNYFNYDSLSNAKKGAIFVNVSRGEISNCVDLHRLLKEGVLGGVGMDVFPNETQLGDKLRNTTENYNNEEETLLEMSKLNNVIFTPHNAFNTEEGLEQKVKDTIIQIKQFYETGTFKWNV